MSDERRASRGRLVALCGIDGSGKTTQTVLLAQRAEAEGLTVQRISFPRYGQGFFGDLVERYLRGDFAPRAADVNPYLAALPYACDRWEAAPQLRRWLSEGRFVLCNRYVAANMAHQGAKIASASERQAFYDWVTKLEYEVFGLPRPALQVVLDVEPTVAVRLLHSRGKREGRTDSEDIHEKDLGHLEATAEAYRELAARPNAQGTRWALIRCVEGRSLLPPGQVAGKVWAEVQRIL